MDNSTINTLSRGLDFGSARLQAISGNLSNINTPGYKRQDVSFADMLAAAQDGGTDASVKPTITTQPGGAMRADGNNVDIDTESSRLAATEIYYQGVATLLQREFTNLKSVISGGG